MQRVVTQEITLCPRDFGHVAKMEKTKRSEGFRVNSTEVHMYAQITKISFCVSFVAERPKH